MRMRVHVAERISTRLKWIFRNQALHCFHINYNRWSDCRLNAQMPTSQIGGCRYCSHTKIHIYVHTFLFVWFSLLVKATGLFKGYFATSTNRKLNCPDYSHFTMIASTIFRLCQISNLADTIVVKSRKVTVQVLRVSIENKK